MDATCTIQDSIHVFNLVHKYVSRILGTYQFGWVILLYPKLPSEFVFKFGGFLCSFFRAVAHLLI